MSGITHRQFFRNAGIPVHGVYGIFSNMNDVRARGRDEPIGVAEFYQGLELRRRLSSTG